MAKYYVRRNEKVVGPADVELVKQYAATGRLNYWDEISLFENGPWHTAGQVRAIAGLFPKQDPAVNQFQTSTEHYMRSSVKCDQCGYDFGESVKLDGSDIICPNCGTICELESCKTAAGIAADKWIAMATVVSSFIVILVSLLAAFYYQFGWDSNEQGETVEPIAYSVLRQFKPRNASNPDAWPDSLGLVILVDAEGLTEETLIRLLDHIAAERSVVNVSIYTSRNAYEQVENVQSGETIGPEGKAGFILVYIRNTTTSGHLAGANEIRWMQEVGPFAEKYGTVTVRD